MVEPQDHLTDVKDYHRELDGSPGWWDAFSPMAHIGNAIESVTWLAAQLGWMERPIDPQAEIVKPWVGDWAGVRAAADVFTQLGHLARTAAININWASQSTEDVCRGRAGEGCAPRDRQRHRRRHDDLDHRRHPLRLRRVVTESQAKAREFDPGSLAEELGRERAAAEAERERAEEDDGEDVFQGLRRQR